MFLINIEFVLFDGMHCDQTIPSETTCITDITNEDTGINKALQICRGRKDCIGVLRIRPFGNFDLNFQGHTCQRGGVFFALCKQGTTFTLNPTTPIKPSHGSSMVGQKLQLGGMSQYNLCFFEIEYFYFMATITNKYFSNITKIKNTI